MTKLVTLIPYTFMEAPTTSMFSIRFVFRFPTILNFTEEPICPIGQFL